MAELDLWSMVFVFMLATFIGFEVIRGVSGCCTPLMSLTARSASPWWVPSSPAGETTLSTWLAPSPSPRRLTNIVSGFSSQTACRRCSKKGLGSHDGTRHQARSSRHRAVHLLRSG
jgi:hypothetical protein